MLCSLFFSHGKLDRRSYQGHNRDRRINRIHLTNPTSKLNFLVDLVDISVLPANNFKQRIMDEALVLYAVNGTKIQTFSTKRLTLDLNLRRNFSCSFVIAKVNLNQSLMLILLKHSIHLLT